MGTLTATRSLAHKQNGAEMFGGATPEVAPAPAPAITLRDYQLHDLQAVREQLRTHRSVLLVQPTGAGKGTLASFIVHSAVERGRSVLFLVNRRALVHDMAKRLSRLGIDHGVIMGNDPRRKPWLRVHVASIDTLHRRPQLPHADILIIDEARFCVSPIWKKVVDRYTTAKVLGMDATPLRLDGRGLGEMFESMVSGPSVAELISNGFLVPSRTFAPPADVDTNEALRRFTRKSKVNDHEQAAVLDRKKLVGDIVSHWQRLASDRKTVFFGINKAHAQHVAEEFRCKGIDFAYVDDKTSDGERDRIWNDLDYGHLPGVASVGVIGYGWDHPIVSAVIQGRHTDSLPVDLQQLGRCSRIYPGKKDFLVLDHAGNTHRHGFYEDPRQWGLEGRAVTESRDREASVSTCRQCFGVYRSGPRTCPYCGHVAEVQERVIETVEAELTEILPRMVCDTCRREMTGAKAGDWCDPRVAYGLATCRGTARRAYEVKKFDRNPDVAKIQKIAIENNYKPGWVYGEVKRKGLKMWGAR